MTAWLKRWFGHCHPPAAINALAGELRRAVDQNVLASAEEARRAEALSAIFKKIRTEIGKEKSK